MSFLNIHNIQAILYIFTHYILFIQYSKDINSESFSQCGVRPGQKIFIIQTLSRRNSFTGAREILLISSKRIELSKILFFTSGDLYFSAKRSYQTLGVIIDENLCWDEQIENISKKVSKGIGMLRRIKPFVSIGTLAYLYQALVQPHFDYCSMVWGNCGKTLKGMLQKLQNRAARVISGDSYEVRSLDILSKLNWKTLEERRNEQQLKCVSKALFEHVYNVQF